MLACQICAEKSFMLPEKGTTHMLARPWSPHGSAPKIFPSIRDANLLLKCPTSGTGVMVVLRLEIPVQ